MMQLILSLHQMVLEQQDNLKQKNKYRHYFYRELLKKITDHIDIILLERIFSLIIEILQNSDDDYDKYLIIMDTYILLGIKLYYQCSFQNFFYL